MARKREPARRPRGARPGPARRKVSGAEAELWRKVTSGVSPLGSGARSRRAAPGPEDEPEPQAPKPEPRPGKAQPRPKAVSPRRPAAPAPPPALKPLSHGAAPGVDKRTAEKLRRGQIQPEAEIDLHGHRIADARRALAAFLESASNRGLRCVLVITGKGLRSGAQEGVMPRELLRDQVPLWLNEPLSRARILAFAHAQARHGGKGALYVLLRKRR